MTRRASGLLLACTLAGALQLPLSVSAQLAGAVPAPPVRGPLADAPDQFFKAGDMTIRFREVGSGEPVVVLHGWSRDLSDWNSVAATLASTHRVIAMDTRGFGKSSKSGDSTQYGLQMADDVIRLLDHLGIARAHLAGEAMGALIVANVASRYSRRVSTVTLIAGPFFPQGAGETAVVADLRAGKGAAVFFRMAGRDSAAAEALGAEMLARNDAASMAAAMSSFKALDVTAGRVPSVRALVMCGTADRLLPDSRQIANWWRGARLVEVQGATHAVLREKGPEVAMTMRTFMEERQ